MPLITKEMWVEHMKKCPNPTKEERKKAKELGEKMKKTSYAERRAALTKVLEEKGYIE